MCGITPPPRHNLSGSVALGLSIASVAALFVGLSLLNPEPIADEGGQHLHAIAQFYAGDWTLPDHLPMLPTYHALGAILWRASGPHLVVLRAFSAGMAILAILVFGAITAGRDGGLRGHAILHFCWLPILFPFLAMVYTEAMAMLGLVSAVYMHVRRRFLLSAAMLLFTCFVRQSNAIWVAFLALWAVSNVCQRSTFPGARASVSAVGKRVRTALRAVCGHAVVLGLFVAFFVYNRGATAVAVEANRPRVNVAQFYLFALFVVLLWLPVWLLRLRYDVRALLRWAVAHPALALAGFGLAVALVCTLANGFANPHPWNKNTEYIRNLPLIAMSESLRTRLAVGALIVVLAPVVIRFTVEQANRRLLGMLWAFSVVYLLPHSLAEPRYYIIPAFFINLLTRYTPAQARCLTVWYLVASTAIAAFVCLRGHAGGGIW